MTTKQDEQLTAEEYALVEKNTALAQYLFHRYRASFQRKADYGVDQNELLSQAYFGLIRAAKRYRKYGEKHGYSEESIASGQFFSVFARKSIIGQMLDYLRKLDHVHTLVRKDYKALVEKGLGSSERTNQELADATDLTLERAEKVIKLVHSRPVYLDDSLGGAEQTVGESLADVGSVESSALTKSMMVAMVECIDAMDEETQVIIYLKYYIGLELPDIAEEVEDTLTSVRRLHTEALSRIHGAFVSRVLGA
jgi:RNA polymerase sigma factor (sigma-70 family)